MKVTDIVREIAKEWSKLSKEDRVRFKELAKKDKDRYHQEIKTLSYYSDTLRKPKKCLTAYMIFVKETRPAILIDDPNLNVLEVMKEVGKRWQCITEKEREYFQAKANTDKIRYDKEAKEFLKEIQRISK